MVRLRVCHIAESNLADWKHVCLVERLLGSQLLFLPSQCILCPMTGILSNWQVVSLGIKADEESKVRVAVHSERVTQPSVSRRAPSTIPTAPDSMSRAVDTTTLCSKNLCLVGVGNGHARRVVRPINLGFHQSISPPTLLLRQCPRRPGKRETSMCPSSNTSTSTRSPTNVRVTSTVSSR